MSNYDEKTGIHYGVISPNSINQDALNDLYNDGTDPHYEVAKKELLDNFKQFCEENYLHFDNINTDSIEDDFNDHFESCGDGQCDYEDKEYTLHISGDNFGIFVIRSPYYTFTRLCSPCAPNAGDLNNPSKIDKRFKDRSDPGFTNGVMTYCLDPSFFDEDKAPYKVYRVDNDEEVI